MSETTIRTILSMRAREGCEAEFEQAWRAAATAISRVPGNVRQDLARGVDDRRAFVITSDWVNREAVDAFGRSQARDLITSALRDLREDATRSTYELCYVVPAEQALPVRIDLTTSIGPGEEEAFERAYEIVTQRLAGTPGLIREELLKEPGSNVYHIFAEWVTEQDFINWVDDPSHAERSAPLARWLSVDFARRLYEIRYRPPQHEPAPSDPSAPTGGLPVRIDLSTSVGPGEEDAFEDAYRIVTERLAGTPGLIREELLKEPSSNVYHIFAEWVTEQDFINWVDDPSHAEQSGPLARWLSVSFARRVYEIRFRPAQSSPPNETPAFPPVLRLVPALEADDQPPGEPTAEAATSAVTELGALAQVEPGALASEPTVRPLAAAAPVVVSGPAPLPVGEPAPLAAPAAGGGQRREPEVLVVGAGPAGLTHAIELARRGVAVRVVDKRVAASSQADKAIGIHCRTMEIWEDQGIVEEAMNAGIWLHGQTVFVNGQQTHQVDWSGLSELPYAHLGLPQYDTERILTAKLATLGVGVERGLEVSSFVQDDAGVTTELTSADGDVESVRTQYLVGCDGAHSVVRSALGLRFEGGLSMFPQLFMLGDVDLDWDMPEGHLLRFVRIEDDGDFTGMLVCVPLKGRGRYRVATLAPQELQRTLGSGVVAAGFWQEYTPPGLADIQAVLDDMVPGTRATNLRWSSIFRIKHGIVDRYREGRVFVAGDAAHLHPPAGGQGMNTGIQDAWNLGWKLALAVRGLAAADLLDSYDAERRPAGKAIVDRAVNLAFTDEMDMDDELAQFMLEMQMTMNYADSAIVGESADPGQLAGGAEPGHRAPDVSGLTRFGVGHPVRLFDLTRGPQSTLLLYADDSVAEDELLGLEKLATAVRQQACGQVEAYLVASPDAVVPPLVDLPVLRDSAEGFRAAYGVSGTAAYLVRPDGHVGHRSAPAAADALQEHLRLVFTEA